jgi:hypothetical protein
MIFKYTEVPGEPPAVTVQHDANPNGKPWIRNEVFKNGVAMPLYRYKKGLTLENTPRPYMEDVEPILDGMDFSAGDRAPFVIGIKDAVWGGSKDDILTKGVNNNGTWNVEFSRKLNTGNPDDIKLETGKTASFFLVIRDDAKGYATSLPLTLNFK